MDIKDHGAWERYTPDELPPGAPANAMFARRPGSGEDWYAYVNGGKFGEDSVKLTLVDGVVAAAVTDPTMLFPGGATVLEVKHVMLNDPQAAFGGKLYDPARKDFRDPPPPAKAPDPIADLLKRIEALESKGA